MESDGVQLGKVLGSDAWRKLTRSPGRDLTRAELASVLPSRGPRGSEVNRIRGIITRRLNQLGFTFKGERI